MTLLMAILSQPQYNIFSVQEYVKISDWTGSFLNPRNWCLTCIADSCLNYSGFETIELCTYKG